MEKLRKKKKKKDPEQKKKNLPFPMNECPKRTLEHCKKENARWRKSIINLRGVNKRKKKSKPEKMPWLEASGQSGNSWG